MTRRDRIKAAAAKDARTHCDDFPGEAPSRRWAEGVMDSALFLSAADFDATYWPVFSATVDAINKRREQSPRVRRPRSVQMSDEEWGAVVLAAGAEAVGVGASARESAPAAWCRRVLLREAELVRKEGM